MAQLKYFKALTLIVPEDTEAVEPIGSGIDDTDQSLKIVVTLNLIKKVIYIA